MDARLDLATNPFGVKVAKYLVSADKVVSGSTLPAPTQELVKIRASQINGCGFCIDMHTKDAAHAGETSTRLNLVAAWREATVFTEAERAALELTEQGTRLADAAGGVTDEAWANAAKHYDEDQLGALVAQIAIINAFNRANVIVQRPAGDYQPGQFGASGHHRDRVCVRPRGRPDQAHLGRTQPRQASPLDDRLTLPSIAVEDVAWTGTSFRSQVVGVEQPAYPQRQAATADAPTEAVPQSFEHGDPGVDPGPPRVGQPLPVLLVRGATLRQRTQSGADLFEGEPNLLSY